MHIDFWQASSRHESIRTLCTRDSIAAIADCEQALTGLNHWCKDSYCVIEELGKWCGARHCLLSAFIRSRSSTTSIQNYRKRRYSNPVTVVSDVGFFQQLLMRSTSAAVEVCLDKNVLGDSGKVQRCIYSWELMSSHQLAALPNLETIHYVANSIVFLGIVNV